jgi:hypothetical protein
VVYRGLCPQTPAPAGEAGPSRTHGVLVHACRKTPLFCVMGTHGRAAAGRCFAPPVGAPRLRAPITGSLIEDQSCPLSAQPCPRPLRALRQRCAPVALRSPIEISAWKVSRGRRAVLRTSSWRSAPPPRRLLNHVHREARQVLRGRVSAAALPSALRAHGRAVTGRCFAPPVGAPRLRTPISLIEDQSCPLSAQPCPRPLRALRQGCAPVALRAPNASHRDLSVEVSSVEVSSHLRAFATNI